MAGLIQIDSEALIEACKSIEDHLAMIKTLTQGIATQREHSGYFQGDVDYQDVQNNVDEILECLEDNRFRLAVDIKILRTFAWIMKFVGSDKGGWEPPELNINITTQGKEPKQKHPRSRRKKEGVKGGHPVPGGGIGGQGGPSGAGGGSGSGGSGGTAFGGGSGSATGGSGSAGGAGGSGGGSGSGTGFGSGFGGGGAMPSGFGLGSVGGLGNIAGALSNASTGLGANSFTGLASALPHGLGSNLSGGIANTPTQPIATGAVGTASGVGGFGISSVASVIGPAAAALGGAAAVAFGAVGAAALINAAAGSPGLLANAKATYPPFRTVLKKMKKAARKQGASHG